MRAIPIQLLSNLFIASLVMSLALLSSYLQIISTSQDLVINETKTSVGGGGGGGGGGRRGGEEENFPSFSGFIPNITVALGRDARLPCLVNKLGSHRAAWLRIETKGILTIGSHVITRNYRVSLTHSENRNFILNIKSVQESDRGGYLCQINTVPMKGQVGYLEVVVPPDIDIEETSNDLIVQESSDVTLRCKAKGRPEPSIQWKREDSLDIPLQTATDKRYSVNKLAGETLTIKRVTRVHMGAYLCIASNGVPPSVSRRIMLHVHFAPVLWIPNKRVGSAIGENVTLSCHFEAFPPPLVFWIKENRIQVEADSRKDILFTEKSYKLHLQLKIKQITRKDFGSYSCSGKNSYGSVEGLILLYEINVPQELDEKEASSSAKRRQSDAANSEVTHLKEGDANEADDRKSQGSHRRENSKDKTKDHNLFPQMGANSHNYLFNHGFQVYFICCLSSLSYLTTGALSVAFWEKSQ